MLDGVVVARGQGAAEVVVLRCGQGGGVGAGVVWRGHGGGFGVVVVVAGGGHAGGA